MGLSKTCERAERTDGPRREHRREFLMAIRIDRRWLTRPPTDHLVFFQWDEPENYYDGGRWFEQLRWLWQGEYVSGDESTPSLPPLCEL